MPTRLSLRPQVIVAAPPSPVEISIGASPTESPSTSPDADIVESSPDREEDDDIAHLDMDELLTRQWAAMGKAQQCTKELFTAQTEVWRLTKRIKTVQDAQTGRMSSSAAASSIPMERCD